MQNLNDSGKFVRNDTFMKNMGNLVKEVFCLVCGVDSFPSGAPSVGFEVHKVRPSLGKSE